jgi:DNA replication protein DnaC
LPQNQQTDSVCSICGGTGFLRRDVPIGHPDFGKPVACDCRTHELQNKRLTQLRSISNLDALQHYTFNSFVPTGYGITQNKSRTLVDAYNSAREFAEHPDGWLVLLGGYGCGKTHLAVSIANYCIEQGQSALFVVVPDLLDHLRATFSPYSSTSYDRRFDEIRTAPLLILDDLGAHASTPWAQEKLFQIFNYRYNARLPTVVTSNHSLEEIDKRIRSRMADPVLSRIVTILAPDFRETGVESSDLSSLSMHQDKTFESFDLRENELDHEKAANLKHAFSLARNYAENPSDWILFTGTFGCGKTHLAAAIANYRIQQGQSGLFIVVPDLLDHLRAAFNPNAVTPYDKRFEEVRNTPLLILDDLGTQSATPWAQEKLYQLFNHRYNARLPTIITMVEAIELDPRLKSRLLDVGRCMPISISAPSYRGLPSLQAKNRAQKRRPTPPKRNWKQSF